MRKVSNNTPFVHRSPRDDHQFCPLCGTSIFCETADEGISVNIGVLWAYPLTKDVTVHTKTSLIEYTFGPKQVVHGFCGTCAVPVWEHFLSPAAAHTMGINVRAIADFDFARLPTRVHNGKATPPQYQV
ncbi:hypothetical protein C8F04DRAFT_1393275 [Mycena alexandri]|uniref:CENP-V/GFA domain-containing protein n=1 Tax=Mycena alexandri TaxID=1745969 RepID=A0AAD6X3R6_9AGAR|nr:hypothetical protein C8F04DRAFT_1393275 [Mycena alexandri]